VQRWLHGRLLRLLSNFIFTNRNGRRLAAAHFSKVPVNRLDSQVFFLLNFL
jgi:hypothetical protein